MAGLRAIPLWLVLLGVAEGVTREGDIEVSLTHKGVTCFDKRALLRGYCQDKMWDTLRKNTAHYVRETFKKVCEGDTNVGATVILPNVITGSFGMSKKCRDEYQQTYKRDADSFWLNIKTNECQEKAYDCEEKKKPFPISSTESKSYMTLSCPYAIEYFGSQDPGHSDRCLPLPETDFRYGSEVFHINQQGRGCWVSDAAGDPGELTATFGWGGCFDGACSNKQTFWRCGDQHSTIYMWPESHNVFTSCYMDTPVKYQTYGSPPVKRLGGWLCEVMLVTGQGFPQKPLNPCPWAPPHVWSKNQVKAQMTEANGSVNSAIPETNSSIYP